MQGGKKNRFTSHLWKVACCKCKPGFVLDGLGQTAHTLNSSCPTAHIRSLMRAPTTKRRRFTPFFVAFNCQTFNLLRSVRKTNPPASDLMVDKRVINQFVRRAAQLEALRQIALKVHGRST